MNQPPDGHGWIPSSWTMPRPQPSEAVPHSHLPSSAAASPYDIGVVSSIESPLTGYSQIISQPAPSVPAAVSPLNPSYVPSLNVPWTLSTLPWQAYQNPIPHAHSTADTSNAGKVQASGDSWTIPTPQPTQAIQKTLASGSSMADTSYAGMLKTTGASLMKPPLRLVQPRPETPSPSPTATTSNTGDVQTNGASGGRPRPQPMQAIQNTLARASPVSDTPNAGENKTTGASSMKSSLWLVQSRPGTPSPSSTVATSNTGDVQTNGASWTIPTQQSIQTIEDPLPPVPAAANTSSTRDVQTNGTSSTTPELRPKPETPSPSSTVADPSSTSNTQTSEASCTENVSQPPKPAYKPPRGRPKVETLKQRQEEAARAGRIYPDPRNKKRKSPSEEEPAKAKKPKKSATEAAKKKPPSIQPGPSTLKTPSPSGPAGPVPVQRQVVNSSSSKSDGCVIDPSQSPPSPGERIPDQSTLDVPSPSPSLSSEEEFDFSDFSSTTDIDSRIASEVRHPTPSDFEKMFTDEYDEPFVPYSELMAADEADEDPEPLEPYASQGVDDRWFTEESTVEEMRESFNLDAYYGEEVAAC